MSRNSFPTLSSASPETTTRESCPDCRRAVQLYVEATDRLRSLARIRPPAELRHAVLGAVEESQGAIATQAPFVLALFIVPLSFIAVALLLAYGVVALLGLLAALAVLSCLTTWCVLQREGGIELPWQTEREMRIGRIVRAVAINAAGVALGVILYVGLVLLLASVSGTAGRIENCQIVVFLAYGSRTGRALLDRDLYLPQEWLADRARCRGAGIPEGTVFATKPALVTRMLDRARVAGVPAG